MNVKETQNKSFNFFDTVKFSLENGSADSKDSVTVEEPLEIKLREPDGQETTVSIIMRTPVMDNFLAVGFLYSEGIIRDRSQLISIENTDGEGNALDNIIILNVTEDVNFSKGEYTRNFAVNSSCGVCGKSNINDIFIKSGKLVKSSLTVQSNTLLELPEKMKSLQKIFAVTGGIHAAGLFNSKGNAIFVAEDIGRHNAVDKVVGYMFLNDLLFGEDLILQVSGRAGFEILQKAAMAGIPVVSSVSAPSSLAVDTAQSMNMTLVCFVRAKRFNIYTHPERVIRQSV